MGRCCCDEHELNGNCPYADELLDLVRIGGATRVARLIVACLEWGSTPSDELTEEMRQQFLRVWEHAERIEVIKIFVSYMVNLKDMDLPPTGGIAEAYYSPMTKVSYDIDASIYDAVYAPPSLIVDSLPEKEGAFLEFMEELGGGVSAVAKSILGRTTKPATRRMANLYSKLRGSRGVIPCLLTLVARGNELQYKTKDACQEAGEAEAEAEAEEEEDDEAAAPVTRRIMHLSIDKIFESERLPPAEMMQLATDTGLGLLCLMVQLVLYISWGIGSYFRHLGDLPIRH